MGILHDNNDSHSHRRSHYPDRVRRMTATYRPDIRPPGRKLLIRVGHTLYQARRPCHQRKRARPHRRRATHARQSQRQPRLAGPRSASSSPGCRYDGVSHTAFGKAGAGARTMVDDVSSKPTKDNDSDHRDTSTSRSTWQPPSRRGRHRFRTAMGRATERRGLVIRRHRAVSGPARGGAAA
jgi:hypothetical protein